MIGIRQKLLLGFGGLLLIVAAMGVFTIRQIDALGGAIDVILRQNYRSVVACQEMTESLGHIDNGMLFILAGHDDEGINTIQKYTVNFRNALRIELGNITLPGEHQKAVEITNLFREYTKGVDQITDQSIPLPERRNHYTVTLRPLFYKIRQLSGEVLDMNQSNMHQANNNAREMAASAHNTMLSAIFASAVIAILFSFQSHRWILMPIKKLIASAEEIGKGNLDLVLDTTSRDEIGQLSISFNKMAVTLRKMRKNDKETLVRTRRAIQELFMVLPLPIAVLDLNGEVEVSTKTAAQYFGLKPGVNIGNLGHEWLTVLVRNTLQQGFAMESGASDGFIQHFADEREHFFQPMAVPVPVGTEGEQFAGTVLIFRDVTQLHEQLELKRSVISTVSHQLRSPLTSLRMSIHLLLEERIGYMNEQQSDLLLAAREECERLVHILDDLLDLNRIESGKAHLNPAPVAVGNLVTEGVEPFLVQARDLGISIVTELGGKLGNVMADSDSIRYVFANLLSNALRFTPPGGRVTVRACEDHEHILFSVEDTGTGISSEHVEHLFEQFYRVPGQEKRSGIGLGLSIVKEIVTAHGGTVSAESSVGKGSVFHFTLPLQTSRI